MDLSELVKELNIFVLPILEVLFTESEIEISFCDAVLYLICHMTATAVEVSITNKL